MMKSSYRILNWVGAVLTVIGTNISDVEASTIIPANVLINNQTMLHVKWEGRAFLGQPEIGMTDVQFQNVSADWTVADGAIVYRGGGKSSGILSVTHQNPPHGEGPNQPTNIAVVIGDPTASGVKNSDAQEITLSHIHHINKYVYQLQYNPVSGALSVDLKGAHIPDSGGGLFAIAMVAMGVCLKAKFRKGAEAIC